MQEHHFLLVSGHLFCLDLCRFLQDTLDAADEGTDGNRLRPVVNKIWPFLFSYVNNRIPLSLRRCLSVNNSVIQTCGGDFFARRRFHTDGPHFWKLLTTSLYLRKATTPKEERN